MDPEVVLTCLTIFVLTAAFGLVMWIRDTKRDKWIYYEETKPAVPAEDTAG